MVVPFQQSTENGLFRREPVVNSIQVIPDDIQVDGCRDNVYRIIRVIY